MRTVKLAELAANIRWAINGGPFGSKLVSKDYRDEGVPVIRGANLPDSSWFSDDNLVFVSEGKADELLANNAHPGDVIFTQRGTLGQVGLIPLNSPYERYVISQSQMKMTVDRSIADPRWLYYYFRQESIVESIKARAVTSGVPHINLGTLKDFEIALPDLKTQEATADCLMTLDLQLGNHWKQISLLEEAARLIYTEWFVRQRFPRHQQTPSNGGIPQGWRNLHFQDVADLVGGGTPSTDRADYWDGDILWVTPTDITRNNCLALLDTQRKITEQGLENSNARLLPPRSILMTSRASIGYFALCDGPASTNQGFICLVPHAEEARYFLLFNLMSRKEEIESMATGATFKEISKKTFRTLPLLMPSSEVLLAFNEAITPIIDQIFTLKRQLISLRQARDLLLPRLISGQLRL